MPTPTHDGTSTSAQGNVTTPSYTHTPSGSPIPNAVAIISVGWQDDTATLNSVTYGGNAATSLGARVTQQSDTNSLQTFIFKNPGTGAATVQANFSKQVNSATITTRIYYNVDQVASTGTRATGINSNTAVSISVSSAIGDLVIDDVYQDSTSATLTVNGSQTQRANFSQSTNHRRGASEKAGGASSTTMSWALSDGRYWISIGVALKPSSASFLPRQDPMHALLVR